MLLISGYFPVCLERIMTVMVLNTGFTMKFLAILGIIIFFVLFSPLVMYAQFGGGGFLPFGGRIVLVKFCTCSANFALRIGPPRGGDFIYQPGASRLYAKYRITTIGAWTLGLAGSNTPCMQVRGNHCRPDESIPSGRVIQIVGTS